MPVSGAKRQLGSQGCRLVAAYSSTTRALCPPHIKHPANILLILCPPEPLCPCRNDLRKYNFVNEYWEDTQALLEAEPAEPTLAPDGNQPSSDDCNAFIAARLTTQLHIVAVKVPTIACL